MRLNGFGEYPCRCSDRAALSFCTGVFQTIPSTPGVFRPELRVTRRTAKSLAENAWVRSHCRDLTLPQRLSRVAFAIRICSRFTCCWMARQLMASQFATLEDAPNNGLAAIVICFPSSITILHTLSRG